MTTGGATGGGGGGGGAGNVVAMVKTPTSPSSTKLTEDGVAVGPLDAPGQPALASAAAAPGVHAHAYDTEIAPPLLVSVTVHVLPSSAGSSKTHAPALVVQ